MAPARRLQRQGGAVTQHELWEPPIVPGLLAAAFYVCAIVWILRRDMAAGPAGPRASRREFVANLLAVWPVILVPSGRLSGAVTRPCSLVDLTSHPIRALGPPTRQFF